MLFPQYLEREKRFWIKASSCLFVIGIFGCIFSIVQSSQDLELTNQFEPTTCSLVLFNATTDPPFVIWNYHDNDKQSHSFVDFGIPELGVTTTTCWFNSQSPSQHRLDSHSSQSTQDKFIISLCSILLFLMVLLLIRNGYRWRETT